MKFDCHRYSLEGEKNMRNRREKIVWISSLFLLTLILLCYSHTFAQIPADTVDNEDAGFVVFSGIWPPDDYPGADYARPGDASPTSVICQSANIGDWVYFVPAAPPGVYDVYAWTPVDPFFMTNAHYVVWYNGGTTGGFSDEIDIDQTAQGDGWYLLGRYPFIGNWGRPGEAIYVGVNDADHRPGTPPGSPNAPYLLADAVKLVRVPDTVWVDDDWSSQMDVDAFDPSLIWGYDAFNSIQDGVDAVAYSTVWVLPGTYSANIIINTPNVEVLSTGGPEETIVDGGGVALYGFSIQDDIDNVRIEGFTITSCSYGILVNPDVDGAEIHNNYIMGNSLYGLLSTTATEVDAEDNWWGSCTGPSHVTNPQGVGDPIFGNVDFAPWLFPCSYAYGDTCLNYMLPGNPDEYLESSANPMEDWWAVVFRNPGGAAKITSISFRFFDGGVIDLYVFTCGDLVPEDGLCASDLIFEVYDFLGDSLTSAIRHAFLGTGLHPIFNWETVSLEDSCITVGPKSCFIVAWQKAANETPRIMADDTEGAGTHSWIWNAARWSSALRGWPSTALWRLARTPRTLTRCRATGASRRDRW